MTNTTTEKAVRGFGTLELQRARRALEAEATEWCRGGVDSQALIGKIELLTAVGAELDRRNFLLPPPPFVDTCIEDGVRSSMQVRVW